MKTYFIYIKVLGLDFILKPAGIILRIVMDAQGLIKRKVFKKRI